MSPENLRHNPSEICCGDVMGNYPYSTDSFGGGMRLRGGGEVDWWMGVGVIPKGEAKRSTPVRGREVAVVKRCTHCVGMVD